MLYKVLLILHLLGSAVWLGGHVVLVGVVLPGALRERAPERVREFERGYGMLGLVGLVVQLSTGLWLATYWIGSWRTVFSRMPPASHTVFAKLGILALILLIAGHTYHRVLPRMTPERMWPFAALSMVTTGLSALMLVLGASIRLGLLF